MAATKLQVCVALMVVMVASAQLAQGLTCGQVASGVAPCINYATGKGPLTGSCCSGIKGINSAARSTPDRQQACNCLKSLSGRVSGVDMGRVAGIPGKCGVNVGFPISMSVDCSKVR